MNRLDHPSQGQPWYREPWPWILMSGPFTVVVAGLVTAWIAVTHQDALVVDNYYKEGLAINRVLERDRAAAQGGYRAELMLSRDRSRVRVHLTGTAPSRLRLSLVHPTRPELDRAAELHPLQAGWYEGDIDLPPAPRWHAVVEDPQGRWRLTGVWRTQGDESLVLVPRQ
jgi:uncharacterized protein